MAYKSEKKLVKFFSIQTALLFLIAGCVTVPQDEVSLHDIAGAKDTPIAEDAANEPDVVNESAAVSAQDNGSSNSNIENSSDAAVMETEKKIMIALTFDDGPSAYTKPILDLLEHYGVRATFFVLGENVEYWQDVVKLAVKNGNEVVSHTWSHLALTRLTNEEIAQSIKSASELIEKVTGIPHPPYYRPPYGLVNTRVANISAELGYSMVGWTIDPQEWKHYNKDLLYDHIMEYIKENSIILTHDIFSVMPAAMARIIPALIDEGYQLVTISELLFHVYGELKPGMMYGNPGILR